MANIETCLINIQNGYLPPECLEDWPTMRKVILNRFNELYGEFYNLIAFGLLQEYKRLYKMWQVNKTTFSVQIVGYYNQPT